MEDEIVTEEKFLLLIDKLTVDQKHHLSIKDWHYTGATQL